VHWETSGAIDDARQATLDAAYAAHPERFTRRPRPPKIPGPSLDQPTEPDPDELANVEATPVPLDLTDSGPERADNLATRG